MKKGLKIFSVLIISIIVLLTVINQVVSRNISTEVIINTPPEKVWGILLDHQSYSEWNPFIKKISGSTKTGETLSVTILSGGDNPMNFTPEVLVNNKNIEFRWKGKLLIEGIFDGEHYFILEKIDSNQTKLIHGERFTGILSGILISMIGEEIEKGFEYMNEALKKRTE